MTSFAALFGIILVAGIVRGYAGFGFSALVLLTGSLLFAPQTLVPVLYLLELIASIALLRGSRGAIDWGLLIPLMAGNLLMIPVGQHWLAGSDSSAVLTIAGIAVATFCFLLWRGFALPHKPHPAATLGVGLVSGLMNGIGSIGGLSIATYLLATRQSPAGLRSTMAMNVLITDCYAFFMAWRLGLVTDETWRIVGTGLPALAIGMMVGMWLFHRSNPEAFRRVLLVLLACLAMIHPAKTLLAG